MTAKTFIMLDYCILNKCCSLELSIQQKDPEAGQVFSASITIIINIY